MANQIALKLHSRPGDVLVAERRAHVVIYEYGGAAAHAGLMIETIDGHAGCFGVEQLEAVTIPSTKSADQRARCSRSRTRTTPPAVGAGRWTSSRRSPRLPASAACATHLDGARLLNAAVAHGRAAAADRERTSTP